MYIHVCNNMTWKTLTTLLSEISGQKHINNSLVLQIGMNQDNIVLILYVFYINIILYNRY